MSQHDIGFNTVLKKWFIQGFSGNRSVMLDMNMIKNSNIKLTNVMCNTYHWGDQQNPEISHGRLTFYDGNQQIIKATGNLADSFEVTGKDINFKFIKIMNKASILKYDLPNGVWNINIDGNFFTTRNIVGIVSGVPEKTHIWFKIKPSNIYFNSIITLYNPELEKESKKIKSAKKTDECNSQMIFDKLPGG